MTPDTHSSFPRIRAYFFLVPAMVILSIFAFLYANNALNATAYIQIQQDLFFYLNSQLSQFPRLAFNITQFGDALIALSLLSFLVLYAPKVWESLIAASIISALYSNVTKEFFSVPRPAAFLNTDTFTIIGQKLPGATSSLPSGHSVTIFTTLTILMFGFMPKKSLNQIFWCGGMMLAGLIMASSRVAVGAHFPLDVVVGGVVGYLAALTGIFVNQHYNAWTWVRHKKYYPIFIVLFLACIIILITKTMDDPLPIFFLTIISLLITLYTITKAYVKR